RDAAPDEWVWIIGDTVDHNPQGERRFPGRVARTRPQKALVRFTRSFSPRGLVGAPAVDRNGRVVGMVVRITEGAAWLVTASGLRERLNETPFVPAKARPGAPVPAAPRSLLEARRGFATRLIRRIHVGKRPADAPPPGVFNRVRYPSPAGKLAAYVTPDPGDGQRHPAVVWAHGGFGGIDRGFWKPAPPDDDQTAQAFRKAGLVLMLPSWRGENDNPGLLEMYYGEVDDLLAAVRYARGLPYVDPNRVYVAGHSAGGTLALLAAECPSGARAVFSFGGAPAVGWLAAEDRNTPFDLDSWNEVRARGAVHHVPAIQCPTFYFEGSASGRYCRDAKIMEEVAHRVGRPFNAFVIPAGTHSNILRPLTRLVAEKIKADTGPACGIRIEQGELQRAFFRQYRGTPVTAGIHS
ncbi:MAG TPA: prolyl oligopeptidase family serine peptidase, partial [Armatimonadota bacterium]|nr:prolyl oligopeptidase family serine peptidase [Armatimonadota bacterium]